MDPDEDLAWPDPELVGRWWNEHSAGFTPWTRYLCGKPVGAAHCQEVLRTGHQRQRIAAALELALMRPNAALFPTSAPAFRQKKLLAQAS